MGFLDELREFLRAVERGDGAVAKPASRIDMSVIRRHFFDELEREEQETNGARDRHLSSLQRWIADGRLERFVVIVERELLAGLCAGAEIAELQACVSQTIEMLVGRSTEHRTKVRERELERVVALAIRGAEHESSARDVGLYAFEGRFVRTSGARSEVSPIGRVLLDLPGIEAVRWVLTVETQQSTGHADSMHMHPDVLAAILRSPSQMFDPDVVLWADEDGNECMEGEEWPFYTYMFRRLCDLGVLERRFGSRDVWGYELQPGFRETLEEIVAQRRTPLSLLAESLLADERNTVSGHAAPFTTRESAAELQARHARMVTHEIRNAIVPMRMALSALFRTLQVGVPAEQWQTQRERVDGGIERLFRFATELEQVARVGASSPLPFDLIAAIQDAIKGLNGGLGLAVRFAPDEGLPRVPGHRARFTLAIVNLLRNAAQNSNKANAMVRLGASVSVERDTVIVTVDDDGPGVLEEHREAIFQQGFALRHGGSGQGLTLVREVVEIEMRGKARCEVSDLGGARFVLALPVAVKESR